MNLLYKDIYLEIMLLVYFVYYYFMFFLFFLELILKFVVIRKEFVKIFINIKKSFY